MLLDQIRRDEGEVLRVYLDSENIRTAGVGHNLEAHGDESEVGTPISKAQSDLWLLQDSAKASAQVDEHLPWAKELDDARHGVLVNMCFNMGIGGLLGFKHMLECCKAGDYQKASEHMLQSKWAEQVGARANRLSTQMITGEWQ